jgi:ankyrin repeat protein
MKRFALLLWLMLTFNFSIAQDLNTAVLKNDTAMALEAIKAGTNINAVDKYGGTALHTATRWGNDTIVQFLLAHGAGVDTPRSAAGRTALMVTCAYYGGMKICSILLAHGANVNATAKNGTTALMLAASNAKADVVELLLAKGADKHLKDATGKSALDYAKQAAVSNWSINSNKDAVIDKERTIRALAQ